MKLTILASLLFSFSALANNSYYCSGKNLKMVMTLDWFGEGIQEEIKGSYNGSGFKFAPEANYRPPKEIRLPSYSTIEGLQTYSYYKHPEADLVIRVQDPTLATIDNLTFSGVLFVRGQKISFDCVQ